MHLQVVNPFDYADWNRRIESLGSSSFFNTIEWARVLSESYGYEPCYVVGIEDGKYVSLLPMMHVDSWATGRRGVAIPFSDYCNPVGIGPANSDEILEYLRKYGKSKKWRYFEVRRGEHFLPAVPSSSTYLHHTLDLTAGDKFVFGRLKGAVRTSIRKADKAGVDVTFANSMESVRLFYRLHCETRRRHGLPPQPFVFFENLYRHVLSKGMGVVVTANYKGAVIAASVFCHFEQYAIFKFGASDLRFQEFRCSTLVMWKAIQWYIERGCSQLSLGRTDAVNSGLRRFKLGWGASETGLSYVKYDFQREQFVSGTNHDMESGYRLARMLPLSVNRLVGNLLYRHMA